MPKQPAVKFKKFKLCKQFETRRSSTGKFPVDLQKPGEDGPNSHSRDWLKTPAKEIKIVSPLPSLLSRRLVSAVHSLNKLRTLIGHLRSLSNALIKTLIKKLY